MATYDAFKDKFVSFDIETTGIDPGEYFGASVDGISKTNNLKPRVWEAAFHDPRTGKIFEESFASSNISEEQKALAGISFYDKNEAWQRHITDTSKYKFKEGEVSKGVSSAFKSTGLTGGMMLIQNARFENRWMSHVADTEGAPEFFEQMRYGQDSSVDGNRKLYTPPSISKMKSKIDRDKLSVSAIDSIYDDIVKQYAKETDEAAKNGHLIVGDMLDFTAATFTKAVKKGHLDPTYLTKGHNVELLSKVFLNEQEVHSAGSDARQQSLIFKEMMGLRDRLSSEQLTEQDIKRLGTLNAAAPIVREESAARGALGLIESIKAGKPNVSGPIVNYRRVDVKDSLTGAEEYLNMPIRQKVSRVEDILPNYLNNTKSNEGTFAYTAISDLVKKHGSKAAIRHLQTDDFKTGLEDLVSRSKDTINKINDLPPVTKTIQEEVDKGVKSLSERMEKVGAEFSEAYKSMRESQELLKQILPESPKKGGAVLGVTAAIGGLWAASQFNDEEKAQEYRDRTRRKQVQLYPEATFKMLDQSNLPQLPYGYAKADWEERIKHHEY